MHYVVTHEETKPNLPLDLARTTRAGVCVHSLVLVVSLRVVLVLTHSHTSIPTSHLLRIALLPYAPTSPTLSPRPARARDGCRSAIDVVGDMADLDTDPDTVEAWRAKAKQRLALLHDLNESSKRMKSELTAAHARAKEAEEAEALVNNGLKTATSLLTGRERMLTEANSTTAALRGEVASLTAEKKKLEKRLALVKTIGSSLQEAKDAATVAEQRLEESIAASAKFKAAQSATAAELAVEKDRVSTLTEERDVAIAQASKAKQRVETLERQVRDSARRAALEEREKRAAKEAYMRIEQEAAAAEELAAARKRTVAPVAAALGAVTSLAVSSALRLLLGGRGSEAPRSESQDAKADDA